MFHEKSYVNFLSWLFLWWLLGTARNHETISQFTPGFVEQISENPF